MVPGRERVYVTLDDATRESVVARFAAGGDYCSLLVFFGVDLLDGGVLPHS